MILRIYDTDKNFLSIIDNPIDPKIDIELENGWKRLTFSLPLTADNIELINEEGYVEVSDYTYIIKEIEADKSTIFTVYCKPDIEELTGAIIPVFDAIDLTANQCLEKVLTLIGNTTWSFDFKVNYLNQVRYALSKQTAYECLLQIKEDFDLEFWFDTKNKVISVYPKGGIGQKKGTVLMNELRLASLVTREQTYDFATVLYPYGKNGLSIANINNGKEYIENFEFCNKRIVAYYFNEDIEYAEDLKRVAEGKLRQMSAPVSTYRVTTTHLPPDLAIGDTIYVIDKLKQKKMTKRVVKITHNPNQPEKDLIELDNAVENISKLFRQFQDDYRRNIRYIKQNISALQ